MISLCWPFALAKKVNKQGLTIDLDGADVLPC